MSDRRRRRSNEGAAQSLLEQSVKPDSISENEISFALWQAAQRAQQVSWPRPAAYLAARRAAKHRESTVPASASKKSARNWQSASGCSGRRSSTTTRLHPRAVRAGQVSLNGRSEGVDSRRHADRRGGAGAAGQRSALRAALTADEQKTLYRPLQRRRGVRSGYRGDRGARTCGVSPSARGGYLTLLRR